MYSPGRVHCNALFARSSGAPAAHHHCGKEDSQEGASPSHSAHSERSTHPVLQGREHSDEDKHALSLHRASSSGRGVLKRRAGGGLRRGRGVREKARGWWDKFSDLDQFSVEPTPKTRVGAAFSVLVWVATIIYLVVLVVQWVKSPPITISNAIWSIGKGPYPMDMTCEARSGCLFSNNVTPGNTGGAASRANQTIVTQCVRLDYMETLTMPMLYSINPAEGISVIYDPTTTNEDLLPRFGVTGTSEIQCEPYPGKGCVEKRTTQAGPGLGSLMHVTVHNETEVGPAKHRREFFPAMESMDGTIDPKTTPCVPDPGWGEAAQVRLRMASFYFDVTVRKDSFWLYLWGSAGGAYGSFFEVAFFVLAFSMWASRSYGKYAAKKKLKRAFHSIQLRSLSFKPEKQRNEHSGGTAYTGTASDAV